MEFSDALAAEADQKMPGRGLRVLDLCAGTGSSVAGFREAGADVVGVELFPKFGQRITMDVLEFAKDPEGVLDRLVAPGWRPDVIWASPPCTVFSMAGSGKGKVRWHHVSKTPEFQETLQRLRRNGATVEAARAAAEKEHFHPFYGPRIPVLPESVLGCQIVNACLSIIKALAPRYWWMENPQGGLQTLGFMLDVPGPVTVTYCQYGERRMKPTCLWGVWPVEWTPRPRCYNGDPCHDAAPRGAKTGTQGLKGAKDRAMIPLALSREITGAVLVAYGRLGPGSIVPRQAAEQDVRPPVGQAPAAGGGLEQPFGNGAAEQGGSA